MYTSEGLGLAWYDGFIPLYPVIKNITEMKHQIIVNISVSSWLQYGRYVCKVESGTGTLVKKTAILPPGNDIIFDCINNMVGLIVG